MSNNEKLFPQFNVLTLAIFAIITPCWSYSILVLSNQSCLKPTFERAQLKKKTPNRLFFPTKYNFRKTCTH